MELQAEIAPKEVGHSRPQSHNTVPTTTLIHSSLQNLGRGILHGVPQTKKWGPGSAAYVPQVITRNYTSLYLVNHIEIQDCLSVEGDCVFG